MIEWYFIVISVIIIVYVSCWLGVEMLAYNLGYQMTHLQMLSIPAVCVIAALGILFSDNNIFIDFQPKIRNSRGSIKFRFTHRYSNSLLLEQYLFHSGKLSLCMWAVHEVYVKKSKGRFSKRNESYLVQVLETIEKKVIERSFPVLKDLTYSVSVSLNGFPISVKIPKKSRKSTMRLNNDIIYSEVVLNCGH